MLVLLLPIAKPWTKLGQRIAYPTHTYNFSGFVHTTDNDMSGPLRNVCNGPFFGDSVGAYRGAATDDWFGTICDIAPGSRQMSALGREADKNRQPGSAYMASPNGQKRTFESRYCVC